ncbi:MAG: helix-turn-helix transcriptional regulator [Chloroflexi bacterium]|nr:helix-turn-helix transcriptional regulator [Chloroflexota bacterium]
MDDTRLGSIYRALRRRRGWRQVDLAVAARCSRGTISRIERGHLDDVVLGMLRRVSDALETRLDLVPRWQGGELDRLVARGHAELHEAFATFLAARPGWTMRPEVSFAVYGERGIIDVLAWHETSRSVLVVELKTELVDVMDLMSTMDRRRRLAVRIAADLGWNAASVSSLVVLTGSRTNRRRVAEHRTVLRAAFPSDGRSLSVWLNDPRTSIGILAMWPRSRLASVRSVGGGSRRVRQSAREAIRPSTSI